MEEQHNDSWGGIPVVIIAGDDYQLRSIAEGAHDAIGPFNKPPRTKDIMQGRELFEELAQVVYKLQKIQRINQARQQDMELLGRLRVGENITDNDVHKLQSLHINNIRRDHGDETTSKIKKNSIFSVLYERKKNSAQLGNARTTEHPK